MKIHDITYDHKANRYVIELTNDKGNIEWTRFLDTDTFHSTPAFTKWMKTFLEDAYYR